MALLTFAFFFFQFEDEKIWNHWIENEKGSILRNWTLVIYFQYSLWYLEYTEGWTSFLNSKKIWLNKTYILSSRWSTGFSSKEPPPPPPPLSLLLFNEVIKSSSVLVQRVRRTHSRRTRRIQERVDDIICCRCAGIVFFGIVGNFLWQILGFASIKFYGKRLVKLYLAENCIPLYMVDDLDAVIRITFFAECMKTKSTISMHRWIDNAFLWEPVNFGRSSVFLMFCRFGPLCF